MHTQIASKASLAEDEVREQRALDFGSGALPVFRDPAFMENRDIPVHRWVPWIAGFSVSFVEDCFKAYLPNGSNKRRTVLDPFAALAYRRAVSYASVVAPAARR